ncbi:MAG: hypothetical protein LN566_05915 [Rickettsia endosymbiont of Stiretrus anchorago]|nr:hypothetical protein [Rickettsia endosymbiont of Stiretrus anchorago]
MKKINFNTRCELPNGKIIFCHMVEPTLRIAKTLSQNCLQELYLNVTDNSNKSFKSSDKECQRKVEDFIAKKDGIIYPVFRKILENSLDTSSSEDTVKIIDPKLHPIEDYYYD